MLERDIAYTLHKPRRKHFPTLPVVAIAMDHQWVAVLVEEQPLAKYNRGYRYLLTVIGVLSQFAWVQPVKAKTGIEMVKAFQQQADLGREFYNKTFQSVLRKEGIHHFSTHGDTKAGQ